MKKYNLTNQSLTKLAMMAMLVAVCFSGTSCQKDKQSTEPVVATDNELQVAPAIESPQGKASGLRGTTFVDGDEIGLYVVANLHTSTPGRLEASGNYVDNAKSKLATAIWDNTPELFYPTVTADIYAYAPYDANFAPTAARGAYVFTTQANQATAEKVYAMDFLTAKIKQQVAQVAALPLAFYHRLSKVNIKFKVPATFKGKAIASVASVTLKGFKATADIDLITDYTYDVDGAATGGSYPKPATASATSTSIDITPNVVQSSTPGSTAVDGTEFYTYEAIVVPQDMAAKLGFVEVKVNYQGGGVETFYFQSTAATTFAAAKSTLLTMTFQADYTILLGTVTIQDWGTSTDSNGEVVNREVFNTFAVTLDASQATQIKGVKLTTTQGTTTKEYTLPASHTAATAAVAFTFDGTVESPDYYPFTITKIDCYADAACTGTVLSTKTVNIAVSAIGPITL
ncbi:MAG: fimbrillin family protein [Mucinivorans sp.]